MKKALVIALVLALGAMGLMLLGVGHASIPTDGSVLLACTGKSADAANTDGHGIAGLPFFPDGTTGVDDYLDPASPNKPKPTNVIVNACVSHFGTDTSDIWSIAGGLDVTITLEAASDANVGVDQFTGQLKGTLAPDGPCSAPNFTARFAAGLPGAQTSGPLTLDAACNYKLIVESRGLGAFNGYVQAAAAATSSP
jgi:hypothetical protein